MISIKKEINYAGKSQKLNYGFLEFLGEVLINYEIIKHLQIST